MDQIKVAVISLTSTEDKPANVAAAFAAVREAAANGAQWVQLPECFPFHGSYSHSFDAAELPGGELYARMSGLAKDLGIVLIAGTVGERPSGVASDAEIFNERGDRKVYNTCYVFDRTGKELAKYRKTHLFNLAASAGSSSYCEADGFIAGRDLVTIEVDGWRLGLAICYDLRFPEVFTKLCADKPCDIFAVPSAFTKATGEAHWELLLRARAVEWQAYVFAANQVGEHAPGKQSYGHSLICDPWGEVLDTTGSLAGIAYATISRNRLASCRERLPALQNKRRDLYT